MKAILLNLALIELNRFCKEQGIPANGPDGKGARVEKRARGFVYTLVSVTTGRPIVSVRFHKSQTPTHLVY